MLDPITITAGIEWLIIGGMTGPGASPCPAAWVADMVARARALAIPVYIKDSHYRLYPIREFPGGVAVRKPRDAAGRPPGLFAGR